MCITVGCSRDIAVSLARFGFIEIEGLERAEVNGVHGGLDVMLHDPPQPLVGHLKDRGRGQVGHFTRQNHGRLLKQQRELASFSRPCNLDLLLPVLQATDPSHGSRDEAVVLEEV